MLLKKDVTDVLEEYIFAAKANTGGPGIEGHPRMLNRFLASIVHPMIYVGNGLEFGLLGLVAQGVSRTSGSPFLLTSVSSYRHRPGRRPS